MSRAKVVALSASAVAVATVLAGAAVAVTASAAPPVQRKPLCRAVADERCDPPIVLPATHKIQVPPAGSSSS